MVDGVRSVSFGAPVDVATINEEVRLPVAQNRRFSVAIEACSTSVCRTSSSTVLSKLLVRRTNRTVRYVCVCAC